MVGRAEQLAAICFLTATKRFLRRPSNSNESRRNDKWLQDTGTTVLLAVVGILCKEQALTLLPVSIGFQLLAMLEHKKSHHLKLPKKQISKQIIGMATATVVIGQIRLAINGRDAWPQFSRFDNPIAYLAGDLKCLNCIRLALENVRLVLMPIGLSCDWSHGSLSLINRWTDWLACVSVAVAAFAIYGVMNLAKRLNNRPEADHWVVRHKLRKIKQINDLKCYSQTHTQIAKCLLLSGAAYAPASNLMINTGFTLAERTLYTPLVGFCILIGLASDRMWTWSTCTQRRPIGIKLTATIWLLSLATQTYIRSYDW